MEAVAIQTIQAPEKQMLSRIRGKFVLQAILLVVGMLLFLFTDYLVLTYKSVSIGVSGWGILESLPYSGSILFLFYGKEMEIFLPIYAIIIGILN